jgi:hypothetical protein
MRASYLLLIALISPYNMAESIEEPAFTTIATVDGVELRRYDPGIQARTTLASSGQTNSGFRRLAGFIFGGNDRDMRIAMTAPVEETLEPEPTMAFTMPSEYRMEDLPAPDDGEVELVAVPARTVAVLAFSGWATGGKVADRTEELLQTLKAQGIPVVGPPSLNQYNPPWTLPFMRRNEIMVGIGAIPDSILEGDHTDQDQSGLTGS